MVAVISCTAAIVRPKEGDGPDRAKYFQGITFYEPEVGGVKAMLFLAMASRHVCGGVEIMLAHAMIMVHLSTKVFLLKRARYDHCASLGKSCVLQKEMTAHTCDKWFFETSVSLITSKLWGKVVVSFGRSGSTGMVVDNLTLLYPTALDVATEYV